MMGWMINMKKRAMKKWIPEGDYCHGKCTSITKDKDGFSVYHFKHWCRNMIFDHIAKNVEMIDGEQMDIPVYRCRFTNANTYDDILFYDDYKVCNVKPDKF